VPVAGRGAGTMRLQLTVGNFKHSDFVTACGWVGNDLYTCCDDKVVHKLTAEGDLGGDVVTLESFPTDMHWFPSANKKQQSDEFAAACSDGTYMLVRRNGRIEKKIEAHKGAAVIAIRWNHEGTAIATAGEDGVVKIWSRSGMLRSTLAQTDSSVYSLAWSPDSNSLCFSSGKEVIVKPLQPQAKQLMWKAHDGTVLKVDWNAVNSLIITGGEDRKYKVWDSFGRPLFSSKPLEFAVTAVAWSPNGELFGVGLYNSIRLCDRTGWTYSREMTETGSITSIAWTSDCTQLAGAGANGVCVCVCVCVYVCMYVYDNIYDNIYTEIRICMYVYTRIFTLHMYIGAVVFGQVLERKVEWQNIEALLMETHKVLVRDILSDMTEELDFRDRVIGMAVGFGYLFVFLLIYNFFLAT
jgi:intraflagellar transport protein 80